MGVTGVHVRLLERDLGLDKLLRELSAPNRSITLKVGVVGPGATNSHDTESGLTNAALAVIHEFGAPGAGIPERSFIRSTIDMNRHEYMDVLLPKLVRGILEGRFSFYQALELLGQRMAADIKKRITEGAGIPPALQPETIDRKGSDRPLVDTGRLLGAITYAVIIGAAGSADR